LQGFLALEPDIGNAYGWGSGVQIILERGELDGQ
jgi:hypothetical protein